MANFFELNPLLILLIWGSFACSDSKGGLTGTSGTRKKNPANKPSSALDASNNNEKEIDANKEDTRQTQTNSPANPIDNAATDTLAGGNNRSPFQACNSKVANAQPILAKVYQLPEGIQSIAAQPWTPSMYKTKICMPNFNISPRSFDLGFPDIPGLFEWFGLDARAKIVVPSEGLYKFRLLSDDGAILYIDNNQIINHDNQHAPSSKEGTVYLTAGTHDLKVLYFQGPRIEIALQLFWTPPSMSEVVVPSSVFRFSDF